MITNVTKGVCESRIQLAEPPASTRPQAPAHKWNVSPRHLKRLNQEGAVCCVRCGCYLEYVNGVPTYSIDDTVYDRKAPKCDGRLLVQPNK